MTDRLVSSGEVARELGVAVQTVSRWVRRGWIRPEYVTPGGQARFDLDTVKAQLRAQKQNGPDSA